MIPHAHAHGHENDHHVLPRDDANPTKMISVTYKIRQRNKGQCKWWYFETMTYQEYWTVLLSPIKYPKPAKSNIQIGLCMLIH